MASFNQKRVKTGFEPGTVYFFDAPSPWRYGDGDLGKLSWPNGSSIFLCLREEFDPTSRTSNLVGIAGDRRVIIMAGLNSPVMACPIESLPESEYSLRLDFERAISKAAPEEAMLWNYHVWKAVPKKKNI